MTARAGDYEAECSTAQGTSDIFLFTLVCTAPEFRGPLCRRLRKMTVARAGCPTTKEMERLVVSFIRDESTGKEMAESRLLGAVGSTGGGCRGASSYLAFRGLGPFDFCRSSGCVRSDSG